MLFQKGDTIGAYEVLFPLSGDDISETYRVRTPSGGVAFLRLLDAGHCLPGQLLPSGVPLELDACRRMEHPGLPVHLADGTLPLRGRTFFYLVTRFVSGETLADRLVRSTTISVFESRQIALDLLAALEAVHSLAPTGITHNAVCPSSVLLNLADEGARLQLVAWDSARYIGAKPDGEEVLDRTPMDYLANERLNGIGSVQGDIFAVGVLLYHMVFGITPWATVGGMSFAQRAEKLRVARRQSLRIPEIPVFELDDGLMHIMVKAMASDIDARFQTAREFASALRGELEVRPTPSGSPFGKGMPSQVAEPKGGGRGFADVVGMQELKELLRSSVIDTLRDRERAERYKLSIPNGMLLYGPPGCGKTYIAQKFAEEAGYDFLYVKSSDLASIYVHGSQEKIGQLFDDARQKAPTILCFDEFDALVPSREYASSASQAGEVNEFLSQLNNCGKDGVFVIASTNRADRIDPAVLRRGRIDRLIYVPLPDAPTRAALFAHYLDGRPTELGIDCAMLADRSNGFVASDITFVVDAVAIQAAQSDLLITQAMLVEELARSRPSLSPEVLAGYEAQRLELEGGGAAPSARRKIGF